MLATKHARGEVRLELLEYILAQGPDSRVREALIFAAREIAPKSRPESSPEAVSMVLAAMGDDLHANDNVEDVLEIFVLHHELLCGLILDDVATSQGFNLAQLLLQSLAAHRDYPRPTLYFVFAYLNQAYVQQY